MNSMRSLICMLAMLPCAFNGCSERDADSGLPSSSEKVRAELSELPNHALMDLLSISKLPSGSMPLSDNSPELIRAQQALTVLQERGLGIKEINALIFMIKTYDCAAVRDVMLSISKPVYPSKATPSELAVTDELLRLVPPMLFRLEHSSPGEYVVMATARMIQHPDSVWSESDTDWPEIPYRNRAVVYGLLMALSDERVAVREEVASALTAVSANDPNLAPGVVAALEQQIEKERKQVRNDETESTIRTMTLAQDEINKRIQLYLDKGGKIVEPDAWPPTKDTDADFGFFPYSNEMRAEARKMSSEEIMELLRSPYPEEMLLYEQEYERRDSAFSILRQRGLTAANVKEIVEQGLASVDPRVIYSGLWHPVYSSTATAEEKAVTDELLRLLPPKLEQDRVSPTLVVELLFGIIQHDYKTWDAARAADNWPEIPYRNSEILAVLLKALVHPHWYVRQEAARYLGPVGANDPDRAAVVLRAIEEQLERETAENYDNEEYKAQVLQTMQSAGEEIVRDVETYLSRGGNLKDSEAWLEAWAALPKR